MERILGRQARSSITRQRILDGAVEVFTEIGYADCTLSQVTERSGMTKGAVYHHFASKEEIASAIIKDASIAMSRHLRPAMEQSMPALERLIRASLMGAKLIESDAAVRASCVLSRDFGGSVARPQNIEDGWVNAVAGVVADGIREGNIRADLKPRIAAQLICTTIIGAEIMSRSYPVLDMPTILQEHWAYLIPTIASPDSVAFWTEFAARRAFDSADL